MDYFEIKNFEKFQHYKKNKKPSWIKLHLSLLSDYDFGNLTETQQAHLLKLWLIASQNGGKVVADPSRVRRAIGARSPVNLKLFEEKGFIQKCSRATPPDKRREEDINKDINIEREKPCAFVDLNLARQMKNSIMEVSPDLASMANENEWAEDCRKLRQIKKRSDAQIIEVWDFARADPFWKKFVLSPAYFLNGDKLEKIELQMRTASEEKKQNDWRQYV